MFCDVHLFLDKQFSRSKDTGVATARRGKREKDKFRVAVNVTMNNCYYPEWRETARQNRKCARVKWISVNGPFCTRRGGARAAWCCQRECVHRINFMWGEKEARRNGVESREKTFHLIRVGWQ